MRNTLTTVISAILLVVMSQSAMASHFSIHSVQAELSEGVYVLDARLDIALGEEMKEALNNGVSLVFVLDLHVRKKKLRWFHRTKVKLEQRYELRYHALSQQYTLTNLNTGLKTAFRSLSRALKSLGTVENLPLLEASLIENETDAQPLLRLRLDVKELPLPLKVRAYTSSDWQTRSRWVKWELQ